MNLRHYQSILDFLSIFENRWLERLSSTMDPLFCSLTGIGTPSMDLYKCSLGSLELNLKRLLCEFCQFSVLIDLPSTTGGDHAVNH